MTSVHWMVLTVAFTAVLWLPYALQRMGGSGVWFALDNPPKDPPKRPEWARRAAAAHANAVENVPLFAALVLGAAALDMADSPVVLLCAAVFFASRVLYTAVYIAGVPVLRTVVFSVGWASMLVIAGALLTA